MTAAACGLVLAAAIARPTTTRAAEAKGPVLPTGVAIEVPLASWESGSAQLIPKITGSDKALTVALHGIVRWVDVETTPGSREWSRLDAMVEAAEDRGVPLVLTLTGPGPGPAGAPAIVPSDTAPSGTAPATEGGATLDAWLDFVGSLASRYRGRVSAYVTWQRPNDPASWGRAPSPRDYAFLVKRTTLAIKAVDPAAFVVQGALSGAVTFQTELLDEGVGPFVDAVGVDLAGVDEAQLVVKRTAALVEERDPGGTTWRLGVPLAEPLADTLWAEALGARTSPATLTSFVVDGTSATPRRTVAAALFAYARAFPPDAALAVAGGEMPVDFPTGAGVEATWHVVASDLGGRVAYRGPASSATGAAEDRVVEALVRTGTLRALRVIDPKGKHDGPVTKAQPSARAGYLTVTLPLPDRPLVLAFDRAEPPPEAVEQSVSVSGEALLSVEEVLARHLEVQAGRDRGLRHYQAKLDTEMWYQLGASGRSLEVRVESRYYRDDAGVGEIENERFFVNGAPYEPGNRIPEVPLLQPEKVTVVPLDVHLDRTYTYELLRRTQVNGRSAYEVSFEPLETDLSRHAGKVLIDAETFDRLQVETVQTNLEAPVLSSAQTDSYVPVLDSSGVEHWLVGRTDVQRTVSILGASVVVRMRMSFSDFKVNEDDFVAAVETAHASEHQMLRETDKGLQYLAPTPDGGREVAEARTRKLALAVGAHYDPSFETVIPLAGVEWLDWDFKGTGLQMNLFAAGAINTFSLADPSLWGTRLEGSFDVFLPLVSRRDRLRVPGESVDELESVKAWSPSIDLALGAPLGRFGKVVGTLDLGYEGWSDTDDTADDFEEPEDGLTAALRLAFELHRKGFDGRVWVEWAHRFNWDEWGPAGGQTDDLFFEEGDESYWRFGASAAHRWLLPGNQSFTIAGQALGGAGLDRFSQYEFASFGGPELAGFQGSGIHFDEAGILRLAYGVDVAGAFGLDARVEYARLRNEELPDSVVASFGHWSDNVGVSLAATFPGPWGTLVQLEVGTPVWAPDYERVEGDVAAQVLFVKLLR